jgi:hypothetical protein
MHISPTFPRFLPTPAWLWRFSSWARTHPWTILAIVILFAHAVPVLLKQHSEWQEVYVRAAERLLNGGDVYRLQDGYSYPPFMAWLVIPFTVLWPPLSRLLWFGMNVGCLVCVWRLAWRLTGGGCLEGLVASRVSNDPGTGPFTRPARLKEHLVCFVGLACSVRYALNGIAHQQTDVVIGVLLLFACWCLSKNRDWSAAGCFGLAAAMKCTALLWCPYLLWKRKWKAASWLVVIAVGVNLLPNLMRTPERGGLWLGEWLTRYIRPLTAGDHYPGDWGSWIIYNQSLSGAANRWLTTQWSRQGSEFEVVRKPDPPGPMTVKLIVYGIEATLLASVVVVLFRRGQKREGPVGPVGWAESSRPTRTTVESNVEKVGLEDSTHPTERDGKPLEIMEYSGVLLLMVLLSPMSSKPHFSTLVLPGFALARLAVYQGDKILRLLLGLAVFLAMLSLPLWGGHFDFIALWFGSDTWNALFLLLGGIHVLMGNNSYASRPRQGFDIRLLPCHHGSSTLG